MFYVIECTGMSNSFFSNLLCSAEKGNLGVPQLPGQGCSFHSFRTNTYKLSFMETPSGIKVRCSYIYVSLYIHFRFLWTQSLSNAYSGIASKVFAPWVLHIYLLVNVAMG
jgi:hypothetical protein